MKSFDNDIKKYASKIRLKAAERHELRERVLTFMEYHPLPKHSVKEEVEKIESEKFVRIHFNNIYTRVASGVFAVLLLVVVPIVAEKAVPGDILYSFKTQINEGIRTQLANSPCKVQCHLINQIVFDQDFPGTSRHKYRLRLTSMLKDN